jgi:hypothetical protein
MLGSEAIGPMNGAEQLALALTLIELGNDVVDFGKNSRVFVKPTYVRI